MKINGIRFLFKRDWPRVIFVIAVLTGVLSVAENLFVSRYYHAITGAVQVQNQHIHLSEDALNSDKKVYLDGVWNVYDGQFLVSDPPVMPHSETCRVPQLCDNHRNNAFFYGSYQITLSTDVKKEGVAIWIDCIAAAYRIYLNGNLVTSSGTVSSEYNRIVADLNYTAVPFMLEPGRVHTLVIELATQKNSGLYIQPQIMQDVHRLREESIQLALSFILSGMMLFSAIVFIIMRIIVKTKIYSFWFPMTCLFGVARFIFARRPFSLFQKLFDGLSYENITYLNFFISLVFILSLTIFIADLCGYKNQNIRRVFLLLFAILLVIKLTVPPDFYNRYLAIPLPGISFLPPLILAAIVWKKRQITRRTIIPLYIYAMIISCLATESFQLDGRILFSSGFSLQYWCLAFSMVVIFYYAYETRQMFLDSARLAAVENELINKNTALLLSQIKPHFIYNSLATIQSMIRRDPEMAYKTIGDFSKYLRANISSIDSAALIGFEQELSHIQTYVNIEKARFWERIQVVYDVQTVHFDVPTLTVQPVVENAIKHGICKKIEGGTVTLRSRETETEYIIEIFDDGVGFCVDSLNDTAQSVGLQNIRYRLKYLCNGEMDITSQVNEGTVVRIRIPKVKKDGCENKNDIGRR